MHNSKSYNIKAFVLKSSNYSDSDKIYTFLAKDIGKVVASARGVRKLTSKRRGSLDTFNYITAKISDNGYKNIQEVTLTNSFGGIKKDLKRTFSGYFINELILKTMEESDGSFENSLVFELYGNAMKILANNKVPREIAVLYFEIGYMKLLGYELALDRCAICERKFEPPDLSDWVDMKFNFFPAGIVCSRCQKGDVKMLTETALVLNKLYLGDFSFKISSEILKEADYILKSFIDSVLGPKFKSLKIDVS